MRSAWHFFCKFDILSNHNVTSRECLLAGTPGAPGTHPATLTGKPAWPAGKDSGVPLLGSQGLCEARSDQLATACLQDSPPLTHH